MKGERERRGNEEMRNNKKGKLRKEKKCANCEGEQAFYFFFSVDIWQNL